MKTTRKYALLILPIVMLSLAGCGGSSGGTGADPLGNGASSNQIEDPAPVTTQEAAVSFALETDLAQPTDLTKLPQVDANIGTVLLTGKMVNTGEAVVIDSTTSTPIVKDSPIPGQSVSFNILAGPGTITYSTPVTDKNGQAFAILATGNVDYTTNVIVEASTTMSGKTYRAYTQFQIVRGTGKIEMQNEQWDSLYTLPGDYPVGKEFYIYHQFPFLLTDSNGNPRVGVPVTLRVHSSVPKTPVFLDYTTITSGSDGVGWFNARITLFAPGPGLPNSASVIYETRTNDPHPLINYKGTAYSVVQEKLSSASK